MTSWQTKFWILAKYLYLVYPRCLESNCFLLERIYIKLNKKWELILGVFGSIVKYRIVYVSMYLYKNEFDFKFKHKINCRSQKLQNIDSSIINSLLNCPNMINSILLALELYNFYSVKISNKSSMTSIVISNIHWSFAPNAQCLHDGHIFIVIVDDFIESPIVVRLSSPFFKLEIWLFAA